MREKEIILDWNQFLNGFECYVRRFDFCLGGNMELLQIFDLEKGKGRDQS